MKTYIITGASKGLGKGLAEQCMKEGNCCILLARSFSQEFKDFAKITGSKVIYIEVDLSVPEEAQKAASQISSYFHYASKEVYLINNAGMIDPIKPAGQLDREILEKSMNLNFLAPVLLSNLFISQLEKKDLKKVVVNVSSGAAVRPISGWSAYCSTKAGLEMFTRTAALEQKSAKFPASIVSFSPGIMDTGMQEKIRTAEERDFADSAIFKGYKEQGLLRTPELVSEKLYELIHQSEIENGKFYDIKEFI
ncbi:(S)-benzoin forming benzil reductase [Peribacillus saganii]|uniref:(S)-benzoin forming benzil reductase n=1 Tax=Peribacillus saganii TaxID=2303992 RepID=A0A372LKW0_9BACI|nr:(S)-benzoin forming benzil reductase [Peribacillus saganii]RFU66338.1 (S)-benzoin forming benzil reductase [Peribacillus saganii]